MIKTTLWLSEYFMGGRIVDGRLDVVDGRLAFSWSK